MRSAVRSVSITLRCASLLRRQNADWLRRVLFSQMSGYTRIIFHVQFQLNMWWKDFVDIENIIYYDLTFLSTNFQNNFWTVSSWLRLVDSIIFFFAAFSSSEVACYPVAFMNVFACALLMLT